MRVMLAQRQRHFTCLSVDEKRQLVALQRSRGHIEPVPLSFSPIEGIEHQERHSVTGGLQKGGGDRPICILS